MNVNYKGGKEQFIEQFLLAYENNETVYELAERVNMKPRSASEIASRYRRQGVDLPYLRKSKNVAKR